MNQRNKGQDILKMLMKQQQADILNEQMQQQSTQDCIDNYEDASKEAETSNIDNANKKPTALKSSDPKKKRSISNSSSKEKNYRKRRKASKPGLTAQGQTRIFVKHSYVDRSHESHGDTKKFERFFLSFMKNSKLLPLEDSKERNSASTTSLREPVGNKNHGDSKALHKVQNTGGKFNTAPADDESNGAVQEINVLNLPFPLVLQLILCYAERDDLEHIISWLEHGRAFLIHEPIEFEKNVLNKFFKMKRIKSFHRQLNLYGFRRLTRGEDEGAYYHEYFLRGKPYLTRSILRTKVKGTKIRAAASPDTEPDFYSMPYSNVGDKIVQPRVGNENDRSSDCTQSKTQLENGIKNLDNQMTDKLNQKNRNTSYKQPDQENYEQNDRNNNELGGKYMGVHDQKLNSKNQQNLHHSQNDHKNRTYQPQKDHYNSNMLSSCNYDHCGSVYNPRNYRKNIAQHPLHVSYKGLEDGCRKNYLLDEYYSRKRMGQRRNEYKSYFNTTYGEHPSSYLDKNMKTEEQGEYMREVKFNLANDDTHMNKLQYSLSRYNRNESKRCYDSNLYPSEKYQLHGNYYYCHETVNHCTDYNCCKRNSHDRNIRFVNMENNHQKLSQTTKSMKYCHNPTNFASYDSHDMSKGKNVLNHEHSHDCQQTLKQFLTEKVNRSHSNQLRKENNLNTEGKEYDQAYLPHERKSGSIPMSADTTTDTMKSPTSGDDEVSSDNQRNPRLNPNKKDYCGNNESTISNPMKKDIGYSEKIQIVEENECESHKEYSLTMTKLPRENGDSIDAVDDENDLRHQNVEGLVLTTSSFSRDIDGNRLVTITDRKYDIGSDQEDGGERRNHFIADDEGDETDKRSISHSHFSLKRKIRLRYRRKGGSYKNEGQSGQEDECIERKQSNDNTSLMRSNQTDYFKHFHQCRLSDTVSSSKIFLSSEGSFMHSITISNNQKFCL